MMQFVGPGLEPARTTLGLDGLGAQLTEFPDGVCDQVVDVVPIIRRGRTPANTEGIFTARLVNTHAAADSQAQTVDPYNLVLGTSSFNGYPGPMPQGFDVWLLSVNAVASVAGLISTTAPSVLFMQYLATQTGFGTVAVVARHVVAYASQIAISGGPNVLIGFGTGTLQQRLGIRIPRGTVLGWNTTSLIAGTLTANLTIGVFPAGLGQDSEQ